MMMKKYLVLRDESMFGLEEWVEKYRDDDYICQGGICVYFDNRTSTTYYCQAMIKRNF